MSTKIQPQLVNEHDAATYLGLSEITLRRQRSEGPRRGHLTVVPWVKSGRTIRYRIADLEQWIETHRVALEMSDAK